MSENYDAYAKRLMRKLEIIKLDAKHRKQDQLVHDIGECLTLLAKLEKEHDRNLFDITDRSQ